MVLTSEYLREQFTRHWPFLEKLASGRFSDENLVHEAMLYLSDKIEEDDFRRLKTFCGRSGIKTFLAVVSKRLFDDFARQKFGRVRPPEWLKKKGGLWLEIYKKLCLERIRPTDVIESFNIINENEPDPACIEEAIQVILAKITDCGKRNTDTVMTNSETTDHSGSSSESYHMSPDEICHACERVDLARIISGAITGEDAFPEDTNLRLAATRFNQEAKLSPEERVFIKSIYLEGLSVSAAGRFLGWSSNQASGKHRRIMDRLKKAMQNSGLMERATDFFSD